MTAARVRCPLCVQYLDETGHQTAAGLVCSNCSHLWIIRDGKAYAANAVGMVVSEHVVRAVVDAEKPAVVTDDDLSRPRPPAHSPSGALTAAGAHVFVQKEIG